MTYSGWCEARRARRKCSSYCSTASTTSDASDRIDREGDTICCRYHYNCQQISHSMVKIFLWQSMETQPNNICADLKKKRCDKFSKLFAALMVAIDRVASLTHTAHPIIRRSACRSSMRVRERATDESAPRSPSQWPRTRARRRPSRPRAPAVPNESEWESDMVNNMIDELKTQTQHYKCKILQNDPDYNCS